MVKIKTKKEMTGEEYAKFMIDKFGLEKIQIEHKESEIYEKFVIQAPKTLLPTVHREGKVIIEVEEEISENTEIKNLIEFNNYLRACAWRDRTIAEIKDNNSQACYILNDDMTMALLWKDGALV